MTTQEKVKKPRRMCSAREKSQAILSIWSGRRKPSTVCRELSVNWAAVNGWEKRAIHGMLKALGSEAENCVEQAELGNRLEKLLTPPVKSQEAKESTASK